MRSKQLQALALAGALVAWNALSPRIPSRWHPLPHAVLGTVAVLLTRAPLGLRPPALWAGLRVGLAAAAPVVVTVAVVTAVPRVRGSMADRVIPGSPRRWLLLGIPLGTVWSEEASFRAALGSLGADAFGPAGGQLLQATAFGLSHIADARGAGEPVLPTIVVTGVAGAVFGWLAQRSGSLAAPMLAHLAVNEAGALAALAVQRRG